MDEGGADLIEQSASESQTKEPTSLPQPPVSDMFIRVERPSPYWQGELDVLEGEVAKSPRYEQFARELEVLTTVQLRDKLEQAAFEDYLDILQVLATRSTASVIAPQLDVVARAMKRPVADEMPEFDKTEVADFEDERFLLTAQCLSKVVADSPVFVEPEALEQFYSLLGDKGAPGFAANLLPSVMLLDEHNTSRGQGIDLPKRIQSDVLRMLEQGERALTFDEFLGRKDLSAVRINKLRKQLTTERHRYESRDLDLRRRFRRLVTNSDARIDQSAPIEQDFEFFVKRRLKNLDYQQAHVEELAYEDFVREFRTPENPAFQAEVIIGYLYQYNPEIVQNIFMRGIEETDDPEAIRRVFAATINYVGVERTRKLLRQRISLDPSLQPKFDLLFHFMNLDKNRNVAKDLVKDVYDELKWYEYKPNKELNERETELLSQIFRGRNRLVDVACGSGRLLTSLRQRGFNITGVDLAPKHIEDIKRLDPQAEAVVGSWFQLPFPDGSCEGDDNMGRAILHNTTVEDTIGCLQEMDRIVETKPVISTDIPDDAVPDEAIVMVVDTPNPYKGDYPDHIEEFESIALRRGMHNFIKGSINDTPDGIHYFDRLALSPVQFRAVALLAGFDATIFASAEYDARKVNPNTGRPVMNENYYWKIWRTSRQLSVDEKRQLRNIALSDIPTGSLIPAEFVEKYKQPTTLAA